MVRLSLPIGKGQSCCMAAKFLKIKKFPFGLWWVRTNTAILKWLECKEVKPNGSAAFYDAFVKKMQPHLACVHTPSSAGDAAFDSMAAIQMAMMEQGYPLNNDDVYQILGWKGRADFEKAAAHHAHIAAQAKLTALHAGTYYTQEDFDELFMWLERAERPLFANSTYNPLFTNTTHIRTTMLNVYVKTISEKMRRVYAIAQNPDLILEQALPLFEDVIANDLPRIGQPLEQIQFTWGDSAPIKASQLESMLRAQAAAILWRKAHDNPFTGVPRAYHEQVLQACIHLKKATITDQERYFFGPHRMTPEQLETKRRTVIARLLDQDLRFLGPQPWDPKRLGPVAQRILELRKLMPEHEVFSEDDLEPGTLHPDEGHTRDSWMIDVFEAHDHPSFGAFIKRAFRVLAVEQVRATLAAPDMDLISQQNAFNSSSAMIGEYNLTDLPEDEFYKDYNIDPVQYRAALATASYASAYALWQQVALIDQSVARKLDALKSLDTLLGQMPEGTDGEIGISPHMLAFRQRKLHKRQAQNLIFESLCYAQPSYGAKKLDEAWILLEQISAKLSEPRIFKPMGLNDENTATICELYAIESIATNFEKACDKNDKLDARFEAVSDFWSLYSTYNINSDFVAKLLSRLGLPSHSVILREVRALATEYAKFAYTSLQEYDDDPSSASTILKECDNALNMLHPEGTSDPKTLHDVLGVRVEEYAKLREATYKREALLKQSGLSPEKYKHKQLAARIKAALKPKSDPEAAYNTICHVARALEAMHQSVTDGKFLDMLGLDIQTLSDRLDDMAIATARRHILRARSLIGQKPLQETLEEHEFFEYKKALMWVGRSRHIVTSDAPYKLLGFDDRLSFVRDYRRAAIALIRGLTQQLKTIGAHKGPYWYLSNIQRIREYYEFLGLAAYDHRMAVTFTDTQRAIEKMGAAAGQQVVNSDWSISRKFKAYKTLLKLKQEHHVAGFPQRGHTKLYNQNMRDVVIARITAALTRYVAHCGTPLRGISLAFAFQTICHTFNLSENERFNSIFEAHGYDGFNGFLTRKVNGAVNYLSARIHTHLETTDTKEQGNRRYIAAFHDMRRLDTILNNSGIQPRNVDEILHYANISDSWLFEKRQILSRALRKWVLRHATMDPTLSDQSRWTALAEARKLDYSFNTDLFADNAKMRASYIAAHDYTLQRMVATELMGHMVRVTPKIVGQNLATAQELCELMGTSLKEQALRAGLGLNDLESQDIKDQMVMLPLYRGIARLMTMSDCSGPDIAENILFCADHAARLNIRYTYPSVLTKICPLPVEAVLARMDYATAKALAFYSRRIQEQEIRRNINPDDLTLLMGLHDFTMFEQRHPAQTLAQNGIIGMAKLKYLEAHIADYTRQAQRLGNVVPHPAFVARG